MLIDNKSNFLYEVFENKDIQELQILTPFITLYGFEFLKNIKKSKILLSDKIEKIVGIKEEIKYKNQLKQTYLAKKFETFIENAEIKSTFQNISLLNIIDENSSISIQGNFDLSLAGLGKVNSNNYYTNILVEDENLLKVFNDIWNNPNNKNIKSKLTNYLKKIYEDKSSQLLYFFTIYKLFENTLDEIDEDKVINSKTGFKETLIWNKLFNFQKDAVIGAIEKLEKYNGCIIADSVGLGKTFEALAVIKYYELKNNKVLVLTPKKLRENWNIYRINDKRNILAKDRFNYDILNHSDLNREKGYSGEVNLQTINWGNYDLIVIDESHNFRNANFKKDKKSRYQKLLEDIIQSGVKTKVLMLSATPVNNRLNDLKNQISFITEDKDTAFKDYGIKSVEVTLRIAQAKFNQWMKLPQDEKTTKKLLEMLNFDYFKLLDLITIARSRKHIEKYYNTSNIGKFPTRLKPANIKTTIDTQNLISIEEINNTIKKLLLSAYAPLKYIYPSKREEYAKKYDKEIGKGRVFRQIDREEALINLMRVNLLKRMESSINSFNITLKKLIKKYEDILYKIKTHKNIEEISILDIDENYEEDLIGEKIKVLIKDIDTIRWKQDLEEDLLFLKTLLSKTINITTQKDNKLQNLKDIIENKIKHPINPNNKKIIIFTAFADTANYLYENISTWAKNKFDIESCLITGSGNNKSTLNINKDMNNLLINFSPISKERDKIEPNANKEIDILIATDCISEGQNLQDCDYLINYDIHWNPVRIIQRFGRIDRIGSKNDKIQLVNFWPDMELDEYINLENRVTGRMVLLDISATGDDNVINQEKATLFYRLKQLKELQEKVIDLEDIDGTISLTDLTLSNFKMDLIEYLKENPTLKTYPTGIHSTTFSDKKGVIFCVKLLKEQKSNYPLHPYYLVFVNENSEIELNFNDTKMILDMYKNLTFFENEPNEKAISILKQQTNNYKNMKPIVEKLKIAINSIIEKKEEVGIKSIFTRGGISLSEEFSSFDDFEIISYLVIQ